MNEMKNKIIIKNRWMWLTSLVVATTLQANPSNPTVIHGTATINGLGTNTVNITNSPNAIINWQQFGIDAGELTHFNQATEASAVLNRVTGVDPTQILGLLTSNGKVFVINPNGLLVGQNARIDTAGFIGSTLNITDDDFLNGRLNFNGAGNSAELLNQGFIHTTGNGEIILVAPTVKNEGVLKTEGGNILLAAGESITINSLDNHDIQYQIQAPDNQVINLGQLITQGGSAQIFAGSIQHNGLIETQSKITTDAAGNIYLTAQDDISLEQSSTLTASQTNGTAGDITVKTTGTIDTDNNALIYHNGAITADGQYAGNVLLTADSMMSSSSISASGETAGNIAINLNKQFMATSASNIEANSSNNQGGNIHIEADTSAFTSGKISATGNSGGNIHFLSQTKVTLAGATLDTSGENGGGNIRVGGGFQGNEQNITNAQETIVNASTNLKADATTQGDGGTVVVWADNTTAYSGSITAKGGTQSGNGGQAEVSGKEILSFNGVSDLSATNGISGNLLLDPKDLTITTGTGTGFSITELLDPTPAANEYFPIGAQAEETGFALLSSGNFVVSHGDDGFGGTDAGAVYLFNPDNGQLISALTGSNAGDAVGIQGVVLLTNGNFVVPSVSWDNGLLNRAGAVTWVNGTTGLNGSVSAANSLVGTSAEDRISNGGILALSNGNYVIGSNTWDNGAVANAGAVTWGNGLGGTVGDVTAFNSLVGSNTDDFVGTRFSQYVPGIVELNSGEYLVSSPSWGGVGVQANARGAFTLSSSDGSTVGAISGANSLIGSIGDQLGYAIGNYKSVTLLTNGNYTLNSPFWGGVVTEGGAVTWVDKNSGLPAAITTGNSLYGTTINDRVGQTGIDALSNGHYVVGSSAWNSVGAVTWGNGVNGTTGPVSAANSLVGSTAGDYVGLNGVTVLTNGNYVVSSARWDNGLIDRAGAATWGNGLGGTVGPVSAANSLVGSQTSDQVGYNTTDNIYALPNGNYIVASSEWKNGLGSNVGAVTWGNGVGGTVGLISSSNSLVGSTAGDRIGNRNNLVLSNGNYVVASAQWDNGAVANAGAVTWGNGLGGTVGVISVANSIVGTSSSDTLSSDGIYSLTNGHYVVASSNWDNGVLTDVGAVTWGNGLGGTVGAVTENNSLVGSTSNDQVGVNFDDPGAISPLSNGDYLVAAITANGSLAKAGSVTPVDGSGPYAGFITPANSLFGTSQNSYLGSYGFVDFGDGRYGISDGSADVNGLSNSGRYLIVNPSQSGTGDYRFDFNQSGNESITAATINATLETGTTLTLQASNDITIDAAIAAVGGGNLTLQSGRNLFLNANITLSGGNFSATANDTLANGVVDVERDVGNAGLTMATGTTINTGSGNINLTLGDGAGLTNNGASILHAENLSTTGTINLIAVKGDVEVAGIASAGTVNLTSTLSGITLNEGGTLASSSGNLTITSALPYVMDGGLLDISNTATFNGGIVMNGGILNVNGSLNTGTGELVTNNGTINGTGTIVGNVRMNGGIFATGNSVGTTDITGDLILSSSSTVAIELGGSTLGNYDLINVSGNVDFSNAALEITFIDGYIGSVNDSFTPMTYASRTGSFSSVNIPSGETFDVTYNALKFDMNLTGLAIDINSISDPFSTMITTFNNELSLLESKTLNDDEQEEDKKTEFTYLMCI